MRLLELMWIVALGLSTAAACSSGATSGGSSSTTTTTAATTSATGTGGQGGGAGGTGGMAGAGGAPVTTGAGGSGAGHFACSGASPSLENDIVPITKVHCGSAEGCHAPLKTAAGTYQYLVSRLADQCTELRMLVEPGHPEKSYLVDKITATNMCSGAPMPKDGDPLPDADIQLIVDWICQGALQN